MSSPVDTTHLERSIALAVEAADLGNRPFGSVVVSATGSVLAEGRNEVASSGDITAHAELVALRHADPDHLSGAVVYASGEPCPMCAAACVWAGVTRIVFAASTRGFSEVLPDGPHFSLSCAQMIAVTDAEVEVIGPLLEAQAVAAMELSRPGCRR